MFKNKLKCVLALALISCTFYVSHSQVNEIWKTDLSGSVLWQQVNSYGNYFVCTDSEFAAYNPETGEKLWSDQQFANIANEQIEEMSESPLISINQGENISMLDPFSGVVKFNSTLAGVADLKTKQVLYKANGILIAGKTTSGDPIML
jgi:outer membrane protein assembly factor BamB